MRLSVQVVTLMSKDVNEKNVDFILKQLLSRNYEVQCLKNTIRQLKDINNQVLTIADKALTIASDINQ